MYFFSFFIIVLHAYFIMHALRQGLDKWAFAILVLPLIGMTLYIFLEVLPGYSVGAPTGNNDITNGGITRRELRHLEDQLQLSNNINNKKALSEGYIKAGKFDEAIELLETCLDGIHKDDPGILENLAVANFLKEDYHTAKSYLQKHREVRGNIKSHQSNLLLARTYEALGETEAALEAYKTVAKQFPGEEARCRYALLLKQLGKNAEAQQVFEEILRNGKLSPDYYKKAQKRWIALARKEQLKSYVSK